MDFYGNKELAKKKENNLFSPSSTKNRTKIKLKNGKIIKKTSSLTNINSVEKFQRNPLGKKQKEILDKMISPTTYFSNNNSLVKINRKNINELSIDKNSENFKCVQTPKRTKVNLRIYKTKSSKSSKKNTEEDINTQNNILDKKYEPNLYGFNLYKHIKENLRNKDKLCKDKLSKESFYCIDCKLSTCSKCQSFPIHKGHTLIPKYLYYEPNEEIFKEAFNDIDIIFNENPIYLDNIKLKENFKNLIIEYFEQIISKLSEIKNNKLKELDKLFENKGNCIENLKMQKNQIKNDIKKYLNHQKKFYFIQINDNNKDNDLVKNLRNSVNKDLGMVESNNDTYNSIFLESFDLFKNSSYINSEILKFIYAIRDNYQKYLNKLKTQIKIIKDDLEKMNDSYDGQFNYNQSNKQLYKMINDKIDKYYEKIDGMKSYIFENVNKNGNYDIIDNDNKLSETTIKQRFDNILKYQIPNKEEDDNTIKTKSVRSNKNYGHRLSIYMNNKNISDNLQNILKTIKQKEDKLKNIYKTKDEIILNKDILQKFFAYESYNIIRNHFSKNNCKKNEEKIIDEFEEFDDNIDIAKPIPCTNEMQLYDKKNMILYRKTVSFDKKKHKYLTFLNGCRSILFKDNLYILGGVDQDKNPTKIAYAYSIKTNELKVIPEMINPHSYHSVEFLDYYKSIIVLGGENSNSCEIYDIHLGHWKELPGLKVPRAHCNIYLDKFNHVIYTFFGIIGEIIEKKNVYTDVIECLELKRLNLGWNIVNYENKAEMSFKSGYNQIIPLNKDMILIYGAENTRNFMKKAAVYIISKAQIVKIDKKIFKEIKNASKYSKKLSKML